jgi:site-specific recombinase XerD
MNFVQPIRSTKKIAQIKNLLRGRGRLRDLLLFVVGINTALRISDLLPLKIGHFLDEQRKVNRRFWIRERKRGKRSEVVINRSIREALDEYLQVYPGIVTEREKPVFFSSQHPQRAEAIKRGQAYNFISSICRDVGLTGNYGTHTLRKTWGYHARMQGVDVALIMHKLNHNSLAYTKRYLGITDEELEAVARRLNL